MQRLEVRGAVRPIYGLLCVKALRIKNNLKCDVRFRDLCRNCCFQIISSLAINNSYYFICLESEERFILQNLVVNFDSNVDMMQQYRRALCVIFISNWNSAVVRDGCIKPFVTLYLKFTTLTFVTDFFGVWHSFHYSLYLGLSNHTATAWHSNLVHHYKQHYSHAQQRYAATSPTIGAFIN